MATILTTKGCTAELEGIIRMADKQLYLVSFNFIISDDFITRLKQASARGVIIHLVYGKYVHQTSLDLIRDIPNVKIYRLANLHAKIFVNEQKCLLGSMNFSEASERSNTEIGVLLDGKIHAEAYQEVLRHCKEIMELSTLEKDITRPTKKPIAEPMGYCIRTGVRIPLNHERPFSFDAYNEWNAWSNMDYPENYCHFSGEKSNGQTSMANPVLYKNWKSYTKALDEYFTSEF